MPHLRGEIHPKAKLTEDKVRRIRAEYKPGHTTIRELARKHSVSRTTVANVVNGATWRTVDEPTA